MLAFASNSLLCRAALAGTSIDAASFTTIRLISGAAALWLIVRVRSGLWKVEGNWFSALALFSYAAGFSFAYISLPAGTGALLLFGSVQSTMIGYGLYSGERLVWQKTLGIILAVAGLVGLLSPGLEAPPLTGSLLMVVAGIAWGIYSLRGRGTGNPTFKTAGNFLRTVPITLVFSLALFNFATYDVHGVVLGIISGALASGLGYIIWYTALPKLRSTSAATVQLSVPVIAAFGGVLFLAEPITLRLVLASLAILGGIAIFTLSRNPGSS